MTRCGRQWTPFRGFSTRLIATLVVGALAGCGGSSESPPPATHPSTGGLTGVVVLNRAVPAAATDALGAPPVRWNVPGDALSFTHSLAAANWSIDGTLQGVTGSDGSFSTGPLTPGPHILQISKTLDGNLAAISLPFTVGDDGTVNLVIEVAWGQARTMATFVRDGAMVEEVRAPSGSSLTLTTGGVAGFGDGNRSFTDSGNGMFTCALPDGTPCSPVDIQAVTITAGPSQLIVGQQGSMSAAAQLSDGTVVDITALASWQSSDATVAAVDSWGTVSALAVGNVSITAALGALTSASWPVAVIGLPPLQKIDVQNASCLYPAVNAGSAPPTAPVVTPPTRTDVLPVPDCSQVVQVGGTLQFRAIGEFAGVYVQDITDQVQWQVVPADIGSVSGGLFTAGQAGTAQLTAALDGVVSDPAQVTVVTQPTVVAITIYADNGGVPIVAGGPGASGTALAPVTSGVACIVDPPTSGVGIGPCCCPGPMVGAAAVCRCSYGLTVLVGDQLQFHATAQYDTGAWADVTNTATWQSSNPQAAGIDGNGVMTALQAGDTAITAALATVPSDPANVQVVDHATLQSLSIYQEGQDLVVANADQLFFHAIGTYDVGITREVTAEAMWQSSDDTIGGFDTPGVFTGRGAGAVQVWATLDGLQSNQVSLQVYETSTLSYCDPNNINRAMWADNFNRVTLESDCASYTEPGVASLRYTVTEIQPHGGVFNPCLDLYVLQGKTAVRTIRNQGCGMPFLDSNAPNAAAEALKYQLLAFWDLKDDAGNPVPPGTYTIYGQFYLYYDPVVSLDVTVLAPGQPTPTPAPIPPEPTLSATPCTPPPCPTGDTLVCPKGGGTIGPVGDGGLGCCPSGWLLYGCTFPDGGAGFACHNPALGCPSSEVCGEGCDPVVTGTCGDCAGGCGYVCVPGTPAPTPTPEGECFTGSPDCAGASVPSSQDACCKLSRYSAMPGAVSWCAIANFDPSSGTCSACSDPCAGLPTPTPTPTVAFCCQPGVFIGVGNANAAPGGSATFTVTLSGIAAGGVPANNAQLDIIFDTTVFAPLANAAAASAACTVDPRLASLTHTETVPTSPAVPPGMQRLRLNVIDTGAVLGLVTDGVLYTCTFQVRSTAATGPTTLQATRQNVGDSSGNPLTSSTVNGTVTIGAVGPTGIVIAVDNASAGPGGAGGPSISRK